tara:strand:- start:1914 stop:2753 length:840 start_codon:yes stop_codon:yes gene_type:complete
MKTIILGQKGFVAKSLINFLKEKNIDHSSIGKNQINFLYSDSINKLKNKIRKLDNFNLIIISAIAPAKNIYDYEKNITILSNIIKSINLNKIRKIVYLSSDAVYSDTKNKISENSETKPSSIHGIMHLHRENLLKIFIPNKKLLILRPTLIYGRNDTHNSYGPNRFMRLAIKNKDIKLFGRGEELRDHIHISDVVKIIYLSLKSNKFGIYNVVTGKIISFNKLAEKSIEKSLSKSKIILTKRYGRMPHLGLRQFNNIRLKKEFKNYKFSNIDQKLKDFL